MGLRAHPLLRIHPRGENSGESPVVLGLGQHIVAIGFLRGDPRQVDEVAGPLFSKAPHRCQFRLGEGAPLGQDQNCLERAQRQQVVFGMGYPSPLQGGYGQRPGPRLLAGWELQPPAEEQKALGGEARVSVTHCLYCVQVALGEAVSPPGDGSIALG